MDLECAQPLPFGLTWRRVTVTMPPTAFGRTQFGQTHSGPLDVHESSDLVAMGYALTGWPYPWTNWS